MAKSTENPQDRFVNAVKKMLARPDYLIPISAAERQYRDHYYGLNSAALLEDLFFDALGSYLRQTSPNTNLTRPPTGQKGWDYAFDGLQISHKVSQKLGDVAALWDATKSGVTTWSFDEPIVYVLGGNTPSTSVTLGLADAPPVAARAVADVGKPYIANGRTLYVVVWPSNGQQPRVLDIIDTASGQSVAEALPFSRIWSHVATHIERGGAANEVDVLISTKKSATSTVQPALDLGSSTTCDIGVDLRGGVYLLGKDLLQNLSVKTNNRAILIPKDTIKHVLVEASLRGLFAPLPLWYWVYAQERPPDMYSAQRAEYDSRFSARGNLDS